MKVEIKIEDWVRELLLEIKENVKGYDIFLGGGYLRDIYCKLDYKDLDIFLVPSGEKKGISPYKPKGYFELYTKDCEESDDMQVRGVAGLIGFRRKTLSNQDLTIPNMLNYKTTIQDTTELQYIIYEDGVIADIEELAEDMDMTLNQVMWEPSSESDVCICTEEFLKAHRGGWIEFAHEYDELRMYSRQKLMQDKFPSYLCLDDIILDSDQIAMLHDKGEHEYEGSA